MKRFKYVLIVLIALLLTLTGCSLFNKENKTDPTPIVNPTNGQENPNTGTEDENNQGENNNSEQTGNEENNQGSENQNPGQTGGNTNNPGQTGGNTNNPGNSSGGNSGETVNIDFDLEYEGKRYKLKSNMESILLIGIDKMETNITGEGYRNGNVADFLILVVIDKNTGSEQAIHINRECMAPNKVLGVGGDSAGVKYQQICLAYTYGSGGSDSCINTCDAVSRLLNGITVDHYVRTTMDSVAIITDAVGGVTVTIPKDMTATDPAFVKGATITLDGTQALKFCRARSELGEGTNINRMVRQRQYLSALIRKMQSVSGMSSSIVAKISSHLVTDLSNSKLSSLLQSGIFAGANFYSLSGTYSYGNNGAQFAVDYDDMMKLVISLYYTEIK